MIEKFRIKNKKFTPRVGIWSNHGSLFYYGENSLVGGKFNKSHIRIAKTLRELSFDVPITFILGKYESNRSFINVSMIDGQNTAFFEGALGFHIRTEENLGFVSHHDLKRILKLWTNVFMMAFILQRNFSFPDHFKQKTHNEITSWVIKIRELEKKIFQPS
ncbi:MAG: hypothetical protein V1851_02870 [Patescibacteria group bacterium]